jgi:hypothetical protein
MTTQNNTGYGSFETLHCKAAASNKVKFPSRAPQSKLFDVQVAVHRDKFF